MAICLGSAISYLRSSSHVIFATSTVTCARTIEFALRRAIAEITNAILLRAARFGVVMFRRTRHKELGLPTKGNLTKGLFGGILRYAERGGRFRIRVEFGKDRRVNRRQHVRYHHD